MLPNNDLRGSISTWSVLANSNVNCLILQMRCALTHYPDHRRCSPLWSTQIEHIEFQIRILNWLFRSFTGPAYRHAIAVLQKPGHSSGMIPQTETHGLKKFSESSSKLHLHDVARWTVEILSSLRQVYCSSLQGDETQNLSLNRKHCLLNRNVWVVGELFGPFKRLKRHELAISTRDSPTRESLSI